MEKNQPTQVPNDKPPDWQILLLSHDQSTIHAESGHVEIFYLCRATAGAMFVGKRRDFTKLMAE